MAAQKQLRALCVLALVFGVAAVGFVTSASGDGLAPVLATGSGSFAVRPPRIYLSGDGTATLGGPGWRARDSNGLTGTSASPSSYGTIDWSHFSGAEALGRGVMWINDGIPDDASGTFHRYPATVHASNVQSGKFTALTVSYSVDGLSIIDRFSLDTSTGVPFWDPPGAGNATLHYCQPPPAFEAGDVVSSSVGLSCARAQEILRRYRVVPNAVLFERGRHDEHVDGFRCISFGYAPRTPDRPSSITRGSGYARCSAGQQGFFFSYAE